MELVRWNEIRRTLREGDIIEITPQRQEDVDIPRKLVGYFSDERSFGVQLGYTSGAYQISDTGRIADTSDIEKIHIGKVVEVKKIS